MGDLPGLNIAFIAGTLGKGGAEQQLFYIASALKTAGARVTVLCLTAGEHWENRLREAGVPVVWVGQRPSRLARLAGIVRALRRERPGVVQSQHFYTNVYALAAAKITGAREVGAIRCDFTSEASGSYPVVRRAALGACRTIAANSVAAMNAAVACGISPARLRLLPNVVDTEVFRPGGREANGTVEILGAGRLTGQKRFDRFLRIVARLRQSCGLRVRATIAGGGPLREELERQAAACGLLPDGVRFAGVVSDLRELYRKSDILLLASDYEGTPNVVLEAMSAGLPVVATRVGGTPDIVTHGRTGFLAAPDSEEALGGAVARLVRDAGLRRVIGQSAREEVVAHRSVTALPSYLASLYQAVFQP